MWGLGFQQPRNRLNRAFKADFVRLLGIIASILTLLLYEGKGLTKTTLLSYCATFFQSRFLAADFSRGNVVAACNLDKTNLISLKNPPPPLQVD